MSVNEVRSRAMVRLQKKLPTHSPAEIKVMVDKLIAEVLSNRQPTNESEFKARVKRKADL